MAKKHLVCQRCSYLLRPASRGTPFDQIEYAPQTQCPSCSLDQGWIDFYEADSREHEQQQLGRWHEVVAPELSRQRLKHQMLSTPSPGETEQMRRNRLYLESVEHYSTRWSLDQQRYMHWQSRSTEAQLRQIKEGTHKPLQSFAQEYRNAASGTVEDQERILMRQHVTKGAPLNLPYSYGTPLAQGPKFVADHVDKMKGIVAEMKEKNQWSHDITSAMTPVEQIPNLPVPGLGRRLALDPNWKSAPPRASPWPLGADPWPPGTSPWPLESTPTGDFNYDFLDLGLPASKPINDYPDAVTAYTSNSVPRNSSNPFPSTTSRSNRHHGAHGASKSKKTGSTTRHHSRAKLAAPESTNFSPVPYSSPGNLGRHHSTTSPLARTSSAAPRVPASVPNIYNPRNRENSHGTTRSLSRATSAAPASTYRSGSVSRSIRYTTPSLSRSPSVSPGRLSPALSPARVIGSRFASPQIDPYDDDALQAFGMTPFPNPPVAPASPQYINPQDVLITPTNPIAFSPLPALSPPPAQSPGSASAPPNSGNNAQGGDSSGVSEVKITRTTFGGGAS